MPMYVGYGEPARKKKVRKLADIRDAEPRFRGRSDAAQGNSTRQRRRRKRRYRMPEHMLPANQRTYRT